MKVGFVTLLTFTVNLFVGSRELVQSSFCANFHVFYSNCAISRIKCEENFVMCAA